MHYSYLIFHAIIVTLLTFILMPCARRFNIVDAPSERKNHEGHVPLIGGLVIYLSLLCSTLFFMDGSTAMDELLAITSLLVLICFIDDRMNLPVKHRVFAQIIAILLMSVVAGLKIETLGNIGFVGDIYLGWFAIPFTIVAGLGVINSINLIDGVDGLSSGLGVIILSFLGLFYDQIGDFQKLHFIAYLIVSLLVFLFFNISKRHKIFLGDVGSVFLGFVLFWLVVDATQTQPQVLAPVTALWLCALPLFDTITIMCIRIMQRKSPFHPDRQHLHHLLIDLFKRKRYVLGFLYGLQFFYASIGWIGTKFELHQSVMLILFLINFILYFCCILYLVKRRSRVPVII